MDSKWIWIAGGVAIGYFFVGPMVKKALGK
jgi:hypothetical protein